MLHRLALSSGVRMGSTRYQVISHPAPECCHSDMLLPCRRRGWQGLLSMCLDVEENRLSPSLATQSFHSAHKDSACGHAFCLGDCLSQLITQGLRLKGCSGKGSPRLCARAPWQALPVLTAVVLTELSAQPLLCPFFLYAPTE